MWRQAQRWSSLRGKQRQLQGEGKQEERYRQGGGATGGVRTYGHCSSTASRQRASNVQVGVMQRYWPATCGQYNSTTVQQYMQTCSAVQVHCR